MISNFRKIYYLGSSNEKKIESSNNQWNLDGFFFCMVSTLYDNYRNPRSYWDFVIYNLFLGHTVDTKSYWSANVNLLNSVHTGSGFGRVLLGLEHISPSVRHPIADTFAHIMISVAAFNTSTDRILYEIYQWLVLGHGRAILITLHWLSSSHNLINIFS